MRKTRKVQVTLELETTEKLSVLKSKGYWGGSDDPRVVVKQVQVNVVQPAEGD